MKTTLKATTTKSEKLILPKINQMHVATQLSLFLMNKPGTLSNVCHALAGANINIIAINISDSVDHSVVRLVVDNPSAAFRLLESRGTLVIQNEVVMVESKNQPGMLAGITDVLAKGNVNIEYAYSAASATSKSAMVIIRPSNVAQALKALNTMNKE